MDKIYIDFFRNLLKHKDNLSSYISSLYEGRDYTESDLNEIFDVLKAEKLLSGYYADNRFQNCTLTFKGKHFLESEEKPHLIELIEDISTIEKEFHTFGTDYIINDSQLFQDWMQELQLELQLLYDKTKDTYIDNTLTFVKRGIGGYDERVDFSLLKSKLTAISKKKDHYFPEKTNEEATETNNKKPLVFISHSSKDVEYVAKLVALLDDMGLDQTQVFCSSLPGYDIPVGKDIFDYLREQFREYKLHVIIVHSTNYYQSPISLNEMGAAWVLRTNCTSFLLPGFGFAGMRGVVNQNTIAIKLDSSETELQDKINQLYDIIAEEFSLKKKVGIIWEQKRNTFIREVKEIKVEPINTESETSDIEMNERGLMIKKSDVAAGKNIVYCPACYQNYGKLFPIVPGSLRRDMFCSNCKGHYTR